MLARRRREGWKNSTGSARSECSEDVEEKVSEGAEDRGEVLRRGSSGIQCEVVLVRRRGIVRDILMDRWTARRSIY